MKRSRKSYDHDETSSQRSSGANSDADLQRFNGIGLGEFLELEPRLTFVVKPDTDFQDGFEPVLENLYFWSTTSSAGPSAFPQLPSAFAQTVYDQLQALVEGSVSVRAT